MDEALSLLDRQIAALSSQAGTVDFLVSIEPALRALEAEPRLAVHLEDLREETLNRVVVFEQVDAELVPTLVDLRRRLTRCDPASDDSRMEHPEPASLDPAWEASLARFDAVAVSDQGPLSYKGDGARAEQLLNILQAKAAVIDPDRWAPARLEAWRVDFHNVQERWAHATRWLKLSMRVSAGLALLRLDEVPRALNPEPALRVVGESRETRVDRIFRRMFTVEQELFNAVHLGRLDRADQDFVDKHVAELRAGLTRLHTELHRRVGMTRSRQAMITRFKQRAEWYDAGRLLAVAGDETLPGGPEDRLTQELALFLFDQGLNPITKPLIAGLEPDLLDPLLLPPFYVEAKQYSRADRRSLVSSVAQILDTVGRLKTDAYPISEAFCVVFRRDGPRYLLPDWVQAEGYRVYFTLIDIAPAEVSGRRQRHRPRRISETELLEAMRRPVDG